MSVRLQELRDRRRAVWEEAQAIMTEAENRNMDLSGEENEAFETRMSEVDRLGREIENREKADETAKRLEQAQAEPNVAGNGHRDQRPPQTTYESVFRQFVRGGTRALDSAQLRVLNTGMVDLSTEQRALGVATGGAGGFTVPQGFLAKITETMKAFGSVRSVANVISTDQGNDLPWPSNNDTANVGAILAENTAMTEQDVAFTTKTLKAYMYTSLMVRVSYQLMNDTAFELEGFLGRKLGERIGRIQNQHFTTGTGTAQPQGLVTGGTVGVTGAVGTTTTFGADSGVVYDNLINLIHSVDPAYRTSGRVRWMFGDTALAAIRRVKNTQNQPLWEPSMQAGAPDTLLGYPVTINPDMPAPAASAKSIAFGDFNAGYIIRDVQGIQITRLDERYAEFLQIAFFGYARSDGLADDTSAYRLFQHSAT